MSVIIKLEDLDDSASLLGALAGFLRGFPSDDLLGLYLFEDGVVGAGYPGPAVDATGNGKSAAMISGGGGAKRVAGGVETIAENAGFAFNTGIPYSKDGFSAFGVVRVLSPHSANGENYYKLWSADTSSVEMQLRYGPASNSYEIIRAWIDGGFGGAGGQRDSGDYLNAGPNWFAWGVAWDAEAEEFRWQAGNFRATWKDANAIAGLKAMANANHTFGIRPTNGSATASGDIGMFGVFSEPYGFDDMAQILGNARSIMADRGVSTT